MALLSKYVRGRLRDPQKVKKVLLERLTEPLHLNIASLFVALFGSYRAKVAFDLVVRQQYAWPILHAATMAQEQGLKRVTLIEFGVAMGAGLMNMCTLAEATTKATGIEFDIYGFDTGGGMPPAIDYRDMPEAFQAGDFPMNQDALKAALPANAKLILGPIHETVGPFLRGLSTAAPIGFVSIDVDYYSSAKDCLGVFTGKPSQYMPVVPLYLDDVAIYSSNPWTGEWLAVNEFNAEQAMRKIAPFNMLRQRRIFKNPTWIDLMYAVHVHDHPLRSTANQRMTSRVLKNEYLQAAE
jgi:hypothetical protein